MRITSTQNPVIKFVRSLERGRIRRDEGVYLAEGVRLVGEAVATDQTATLALYDPDLLNRSTAGSFLLDRLPHWASSYYEVDPRVLAVAGQTETPSGVLAVLREPVPPPLAAHAHDRFGLILDRLADPGNAGTILRTATAAGVSYVVAVPGTADLFGPKVVRAGAGAHFRIPLYPDVSWDDVERTFPGIVIVGASAERGKSIYRFEWTYPAALVVGNEAYGLSSDAGARTSAWVNIPMVPGVESLNAAVAASIVIYAALGPSIAAEA